MKPEFTTVEKVPNWAACWFANGDDSGLNDEDRARIAEYEKELTEEGLRLVAPIEGTESEFEPYPAFGLACDTTDWTAERIPKESRDTIAS